MQEIDKMAESPENYHFYAEIINNIDTNKEYYGPSEPPSMPTKGGFISHTVTAEQQYRADKIAELYYGDSLLSWVIDQSNNFTGKDKFRGYVNGTVVKVPTRTVLVKLGIINE